MRDAILVLHRWLGLSVGIVFGIASLTGAVLVFETELDARLNRGRFAVSPGMITPPALDAALGSIAGDARVRRVRWPHAREPVFEVELEEEAGPRILWLDPGSGEEIRPVRGRNRLVPAIRRTHTTLFAGVVGHWLVTVSCALALIGLITGLILWWPGLARFAHGFAIRLRRGLWIFNYDVHQVLGTLAFPLLIALTLTGVLIPFPAATSALARPFVGTPEPEPSGAAAAQLPLRVDAEAGSETPFTGVADLIERATAAAGGEAEPDVVVFPAQATEPVDVRLRIRPLGQAGGTLRVWIDPGSGAVLRVRDPRVLPPAERIATIDVFNVHIGAFGGAVVRWLWFGTCLIGAMSLPTGVLIWWLKRARKLRSADARAGRRDV